MNYKICEGCDQKYCGWWEREICRKCGGRLLRITREEFYSEEERGLEYFEEEGREKIN